MTYNNNQNQLSKELFDSTGNLFESILSSLMMSDSKRKKFRFVFDTYARRLIKYVETQGNVQAALKFRELRRIATCISVDEDFVYDVKVFRPMKGVKCPHVLCLLYPLLISGNVVNKRIALTICGIVNSIHCDVDNDFSKITGESTATHMDEIITQMRELLPKCKWLSKSSASDLYLKEKDCSYISFRGGPNGVSALTLPVDLLALQQDPKLLGQVRALLKVLNPNVLSDMDNVGFQLSSKSSQLGIHNVKLCHSKVVQLSEKAGKTRKIAIVDAWSQSALKPIHEHVFSVLEGLVPDGTFNQDRAFARAVKLANDTGKSFSFDLSSATDRFPLILQQLVLTHMLGEEIANLWADVIARREFSYQLGKKTVRGLYWKVGQPLGALSSWGVFALCHHIFIRLCAGSPDFDNYEILGDDIQIFDENVANAYLLNMKKIGVEISLPKSFTTQHKIPHGEFCKRIYLGSTEISPIPFGILKKASKDVYSLPGLVKVLSERWGLPLATLAEMNLSMVYKTKSEMRSASILLGYCLSMDSGKPEFPLDCVYPDMDSLEFDVLSIVTLSIYDRLKPYRQIITELLTNESYGDFGPKALFSNALLETGESSFREALQSSKKSFVNERLLSFSKVRNSNLLTWLWESMTSHRPTEPLYLAFREALGTVEELAETAYFHDSERFRESVRRAKYLPDGSLRNVLVRLNKDSKDSDRTVSQIIVTLVNKLIHYIPPKYSDKHFAYLKRLEIYD